MDDGDAWWMRVAIDVAAAKGSEPADAPIGAVVVRDGELLATGGDREHHAR